MIYFTSDLHLGHANVIRHCDRPFGCVEYDPAMPLMEYSEEVCA